MALTAGQLCAAGRVVGLVLLSGYKSPVVFNIAGTEVGLPGIVRDVGLIGRDFCVAVAHAQAGA